MHQDFDNETDANKFRDAKRAEGLAASRFDYGQNRFRVKVWTPTQFTPLGRMQQSLSAQAYELAEEIETLAEITKLLASPDALDTDNLQQLVMVAKWLNKNHWFKYPEDTVRFFDRGVTDNELETIKRWVSDSLQENEDQWNDKED